MFNRRSKRKSKEKKTKTEIKRKKQGCCKRCIRKICRWCGRKISRCIKRKVFGVPDPHFSDYKITGLSFGDVKNPFKRTKNLSKLELSTSKFRSNSIQTLFRQYLSKTKTAVKNIDLIEGLTPEDLKKKFSIKKSQAKILEDMVEDYNGGKLSSTWSSQKEKLDDKKLSKILNDYRETRMKKVDTSLKNFVTNADDLKRKFSITGSKQKILDKMVNDYKKGAVSLSMLPNEHKLDPKKMDKEQLIKVLDDYAEVQNKKSLLKLSRLKQFTSSIKNVYSSLPGQAKKWFKK